MVRQSFLVIVLLSLFSNISFSASDTDLAKRFAHAQGLVQKGEIKQAIYAYTALIESNPQLPEAYNNLAALYLKQKNTKQAKHILEKGLYAHKGYGVLYESLTAINVALAREAYSKALQIDLKPSDITIASLAFNDNKQTRKPIVISKVENPVVGSTTPLTKSIVDVKPAVESESEFSGEIKRAGVERILARKIENTETIETVLHAWSAAWSAQAANMYLSFYHKQYKPSNGMSLNGWMQSRRYRLKKPSWIKVALSDFKIEKNTGKQAIVNFKQSYQSNSFHDTSKKQMVLLYTNDGWRIFREKSL